MLMGEETTEGVQIRGQGPEPSLEERVKGADREYRRLMDLGGELTEDFDDAILSRFDLTSDNGGLDAFIKFQQEKRKQLDNKLDEIRSEKTKHTGIRGFIDSFRKK